MSFASKLQEIRLENNISQEGFAEMLGVSRQSVSKWERGKGYPEIDKLIFISERFGISLDELLKEKKDASGNPRRTINLTKDNTRSVRTEYPENSTSAAEEIYPGGKPYAEEEKPDFFNHEVVSEGAGLAQYTNYSYTEQNSQRVADTRRRGFFERFRRNIRKRRIPIIISCFIVSFIGFIAGIINQFQTSARHGYESPIMVEYEPADEYSYNYNGPYAEEDSVSLRYMIDESTGTRYIFVKGEYGLVTDLSETNLSDCVKVTEISTGDQYYCDPYYTDGCAGIITEQNICYYIPAYLLSEGLEAEFQKSYTAYQDINSLKWYFVPNWIIENADKGLDGLTIEKKEDNQNEIPEADDAPDIKDDVPAIKEDIPAAE